MWHVRARGIRESCYLWDKKYCCYAIPGVASNVSKLCDSWHHRHRIFQAGAGPYTRFAYQDSTCVRQVTLPFVHHSRHKHRVHLSLLLSLAYAHVSHTWVRSSCPSLHSQHHPVVRDFTSWCLPGNRVITRSHFPNAIRVPCILKYMTFSRHARLSVKSLALQRKRSEMVEILFYEFIPT